MGVGRASNHAEFFPLPLAPSRLGEGGNKKTYPRKRPSPPPSGAACPGGTAPRDAVLRGAPAGLPREAGRWGGEAGEGWPPAGGAGKAPAQKCRLFFLSAEGDLWQEFHETWVDEVLRTAGYRSTPSDA